MPTNDKRMNVRLSDRPSEGEMSGFTVNASEGTRSNGTTRFVADSNKMFAFTRDARYKIDQVIEAGVEKTLGLISRWRRPYLFAPFRTP